MLYTECAKIKKNNSGAKRLRQFSCASFGKQINCDNKIVVFDEVYILFNFNITFVLVNLSKPIVKHAVRTAVFKH